MYKRVIIPTDGSKTADFGVKEGVKVARSLGIPTLCIYVMDYSALEGVSEDIHQENVRRGMKNVGERALKEVRKRAHEMDVEIQTKNLIGTPYKRIVDAAGENDIIYICSHGRSGISSLFIGSTTERVVKHAECTVAVVKAR